MKPSVKELLSKPQNEVVEFLGTIYEHSPWVGESLTTYHQHELPSIETVSQLSALMKDIVDKESKDKKLTLLCAHPDLCEKVGVFEKLTKESQEEQSKSGLQSLTNEELERFTKYNTKYREKFGFPFILAVRNATKFTVLAALQGRVSNSNEVEFVTALQQVHKIAWMRLLSKLDTTNAKGFLTCHVLDTANGCPAAGMRIQLRRISDSTLEPNLSMEFVTNNDGRLDGGPALSGGAEFTVVAAIFYIFPYAMTMSSPEEGSGYRQFLASFCKAHGSLQLLVVSTVYAIGVGSVLGLVPQTLTNRYAKINYGFSGNCHDFVTKPPECQGGSDDAQSAAAWSHVGLSILLLFVNPIFSSLSDIRGRKPVTQLALAISCIPAFVFYIITIRPEMHPKWYYVSSTLIGIVNYLGIAFAGCSDVIPERFRASAFGVLLAGYFGGYSLAPSMTLIFTKDSYVALFSLFCSIIALILSILYVPETLPDPLQNEQADSPPFTDEPEVSLVSNQSETAVQVIRCSETIDNMKWIWMTASKPIREISIINRSISLKLVSLGCFCSAMVLSIDATLVIYYIEQKFDVQKADIALMTLALGISGIIIQGVCVHPIVSGLGEKGALILAFACGTLHNFLYGSARTKVGIYAALIISQLTKTNIPILSSVASKEVEPTEQGRIQGAIFAVNAIGNAVGPILVRFIYHHFTPKFGAGSTFIYASIIYVIGTVVVSFIPKKSSVDQVSPTAQGLEYEEESLAEPLVNADESAESADTGSYDAI